MKQVLIIISIIFLASCTLKIKNPREPYLQIKTSEKCTYGQAMKRSKIVASCVMENKSIMKAAKMFHKIAVEEFKPIGKTELERLFEMAVVIGYLDDRENNPYPTFIGELIESSFDSLDGIINDCFDLPREQLKCKEETKYRVEYFRARPYEYDYSYKRVKYIKCSEAKNPTHKEQCSK